MQRRSERPSICRVRLCAYWRVIAREAVISRTAGDGDSSLLAGRDRQELQGGKSACRSPQQAEQLLNKAGERELAADHHNKLKVQGRLERAIGIEPTTFSLGS